MMTFNSFNQLPCPIWGVIDDDLIGRVLVGQQLFNSPRAGGPFRLEGTGVGHLKWLSETRQLTDRGKANLSYWIYAHNLRIRVFDEWPSVEHLIVLDRVWVEGHWAFTPSDEERMLAFLREMIRKNDTNERPNGELLMAAGGCCHGNDLWKLQRDATARGWLEGGDPSRITLPARTYVEEQLCQRGG